MWIWLPWVLGFEFSFRVGLGLGLGLWLGVGQGEGVGQLPCLCPQRFHRPMGWIRWTQAGPSLLSANRQLQWRHFGHCVLSRHIHQHSHLRLETTASLEHLHVETVMFWRYMWQSQFNRLPLITCGGHCHIPLQVNSPDGKKVRGICDLDPKPKIVLEERLKIKYHVSSRKLASFDLGDWRKPWRLSTIMEDVEGTRPVLI